MIWQRILKIEERNFEWLEKGSVTPTLSSTSLPCTLTHLNTGTHGQLHIIPLNSQYVVALHLCLKLSHWQDDLCFVICTTLRWRLHAKMFSCMVWQLCRPLGKQLPNPGQPFTQRISEQALKTNQITNTKRNIGCLGETAFAVMWSWLSSLLSVQLLMGVTDITDEMNRLVWFHIWYDFFIPTTELI